ncbi:unnamed protein product [Rangifer tarandus platyrhynchus]|uniref:Uncharacterized protein n=1 Tax=Rangifer tarandus platyrhynchus TaxID=3082113 RepID=A0AC59ZL48_RANTA
MPLLCDLLCNLINVSPPGSAVHGISQAWICTWGWHGFQSHYLRCTVCRVEVDQRPVSLDTGFKSPFIFSCWKDSCWRVFLLSSAKKRKQIKILSGQQLMMPE